MQKQNHRRHDFDSIGEQKSNKKIYFFLKFMKKILIVMQ